MLLEIEKETWTSNSLICTKNHYATQDTHISCCHATFHALSRLAPVRLLPLRNMSLKTGGQGFEPQLPDPESGVLPIKLSPINHLVFYHIC